MAYLRKIAKIILIILGIATFGAFSFFFVGEQKPAQEITWGLAFSQKHAQLLGLNWQDTYLALLDDLGVKHLKLIAYWDLIEKEPGEYDFSDLDWQIKQAKQRGAKILLVIGKKVPRWPECHEPDWIRDQKPKTKNQKLLEYVVEIVNRYKDSPAIWAWQVENEPLFPYGECPPRDKKFLQEEINLVKSLDPKKPVLITDSGEFPFWFSVAQLGDIVGVTMYRKAWFKEFGIYISYPLPPVFYSRKALLVEKFFHKKVICIELQAEPWGPVLLYDLPLEEQKKTMNLEQFKKNIEFAKNTGFDEFYLWGAEWWQWLRVQYGDSSIWDEARKLWLSDYSRPN